MTWATWRSANLRASASPTTSSTTRTTTTTIHFTARKTMSLAFYDVAQAIDLNSEAGEPGHGGIHPGLVAVDLADHPAHVLLHAGPPDVGQDTEFLHHAADDRLAHQLLP